MQTPIARVAEETVLNLKELECRIEVLKNDLAALCVNVGHHEAARISVTPVAAVDPRAQIAQANRHAALQGIPTSSIVSQFPSPWLSGLTPFASASPYAAISPFAGISPFGASPFASFGTVNPFLGSVGSPWSTPYPSAYPTPYATPFAAPFASPITSPAFGSSLGFR